MGAFISAIPGAVGLGLIWGIMAIGVYITFRVLDFADLTVDGTLATGGAVLVISMMNGMNVWVALLFAFLAGCMAGLVTGVLNTLLGIPPILAGILTQLALYSINLRILGKSNQALSIYKYHVLASMTDITKAIIIVAIFVVAIYYVVMQFVISLGLNTDDLKLLTAAIVAVFLGIPYLKGQYAQKHIKIKEGNK